MSRNEEPGRRLAVRRGRLFAARFRWSLDLRDENHSPRRTVAAVKERLGWLCLMYRRGTLLTAELQQKTIESNFGQIGSCAPQRSAGRNPRPPFCRVSGSERAARHSYERQWAVGEKDGTTSECHAMKSQAGAWRPEEEDSFAARSRWSLDLRDENHSPGRTVAAVKERHIVRIPLENGHQIHSMMATSPPEQGSCLTALMNPLHGHANPANRQMSLFPGLSFFCTGCSD